MIAQTIPEIPPPDEITGHVADFSELAQTGAPEWVVPAAMFAVALLLVGAALVWLAAQVRGVRR